MQENPKVKESPQLNLWENPACNWDAVIEGEIRRIAPLKAYEFRFPPSDWGEFEAYCVERLLERRRRGAGVYSAKGVPRAMNRLAIDWGRRQGRVKRQKHEDISEFEAVTDSHRAEDVDSRIVIADFAEVHPWLAVAGSAIAAGFKLSVIAAAFDMTVDEVNSKLQIEREAAASLF